MLRAGSAGSNTAADHIETARLALAQLPRHPRRRVLIRTDSGGGTHGLLEWLAGNARRLHYSVGMTIAGRGHRPGNQPPAKPLRPAHQSRDRG